jgi:hypothetical protein
VVVLLSNHQNVFLISVVVAAGILRRQISDITISDDEYPAPEAFSISNYGAKLPSSFLIRHSRQQTIALLFQWESFEHVYL